MHTQPMMGCNFTKLGSDGVGSVRAKLPTRLHPLLVHRVTEMRAWRLPLYPTKDTPSKKALLLNNGDKPSPTKTVVGNIYGLKIATKPNLRIKVHKKSPKSDKKLDVYVDADDEFRTISAFPASPSFRVFFQDALDHNRLTDVGQNVVIKEIVPVCDCATSEVGKRVKKEGKRRNIRRVVSGRGREARLAVKKSFETLSNVKSCYHANTISAAQRRKESL